jgi:hypothetical protein
MPTEKEIIEAADAAVASLTDKTFGPSMLALVNLIRGSGMEKPDIVKVIPHLFDLIAGGMSARKAADAVLVEFGGVASPE